ncbi:dipeptidase PepV [Dorea sp. D27]|uniref:dipeptidase PepV n=1 Tax=Dorea sp. D27 TaxID=658665 RepID=UPI0018DB1BA1|nr:dipeptidase PepV [Dorea sp. D27]
MEHILNNLIDEYQKEIVKTTQRLIAHPSLYEEGREGAPFGAPIEAALEEVLKVAEELGFDTVNHEGYAGTARWGQGGKQIGILTHIDVVPPGDGWSYPPFEGTIDNGRLYGRGSLDDKGPMVAALFAMKVVKESGLPVKNHVCHIIGTDEESGFMRGLKYYLKKEEAPWGGFSPDGEFPVIHAEKGILRFYVSETWEKPEEASGMMLQEVRGGTKVNVVPGYAYAIVGGAEDAGGILRESRESYTKKDKISISEHISSSGQGRGWKIEAKGQGGHSSQPWNGENAIQILLEFLHMLPLYEEGKSRFASKIEELFGDGYRGERLGVACEDKLSGILTLSLGVLEVGEDSGKATVEIRYPIHASEEVILKTLRVACAQQKVELDIYQDKKHIYMPVQAPLIQTLLHVYQETAKQADGPVVIGGGTYCRAAENFAAYGPVFPGQRELAHEPDEYICVDDLILSAKIYAQALYTLLNIS